MSHLKCCGKCTGRKPDWQQEYLLKLIQMMVVQTTGDEKQMQELFRKWIGQYLVLYLRTREESERKKSSAPLVVPFSRDAKHKS